MLKKQNGITLIALIITIIVMLILVGVTINVALNGGLFTKASEASKQMQVEADRETLLSAVVAAIGYDGKVDLEDIELPTGWTGTNGTYTSPKGNTFSVDETGKITEGGSGSNPGTDKPQGTTLISMYRAGESCTEANCTNEGHLHVGDYVDYTPSTEVTVYYPDGQDESKIGQYTGWKVEEGGILQTVQQENLNWRVFGAEGDKILLISEQPTEAVIGFDGYIAYNNYEKILYDACNTLYSNTYSNGETAQARSILLEDITQRDGTNEVVSSTVYAIDPQTGNLTLGGTTNNITLNCKGFLDEEDSTIDTLMSSENAKKRELLQGSNKEFWYMIGTRMCYKDTRVNFGPFWLGEGQILKTLQWCAIGSATLQEGGGEGLYLRPIVELSSGVITEQVPVIGESLN